MNFRNRLRDAQSWIDRPLQVDSKQMGGTSFRQPVLVELKAGHQNHIVLFARPFLFEFNRFEIFIDFVEREHHPGQICHLTDQARVVADMVRDTQGIETPLPIKIDKLPNGQLPVREISVRMEIAQDNGAAIFPLRIRPEKTLKLLRRRIFRRSKFKNKAAICRDASGLLSLEILATHSFNTFSPRLKAVSSASRIASGSGARQPQSFSTISRAFPSSCPGTT